ncbi:MAG TPA: hypothetical protein PKC49_13705 [Phycisphaerae bacterium]|mgnify:CR=1 FL=1|nr:hypothetical protein [Phycisphaerae bacterium]
MPSSAETAGLWLRWVRDNAVARLRASTAQPRRTTTAATLACLLLLGGVAIGWSAAGLGTTWTRQAADSWRFVVICNACAERTRYEVPPKQVLPSRDGLLQCPKCGKFAAGWYRRGSLSVPPGGF